MKRVCAVLAAGLLLVSAGCGRAQDPDVSEESVPDSSPDSFIQTDPTDPTEPEETPTGGPTEGPTRGPSSSSPSSATKPPPTTVPTEPPKAETVRITFKEGDSLTKIFLKLEENGVTSFSKLMEAARTLDLRAYPLAAAMPQNQNRCFRLEGYLFPDTYEFYIGERPDRVLSRMLQNTETRITDAMRQKAGNLGRSMDEILIIASVIQREGSKASEMPKIAAIIYNRLNSGMRLQMDGTTDYLDKQVDPYLSGNAGSFDAYYDTYRISGLPAGPICSPGTGAIQAALSPADVPYLYFCNDAAANYYYAVSYEEHLENLKKAGLRPAE